MGTMSTAIHAAWTGVLYLLLLTGTILVATSARVLLADTYHQGLARRTRLRAERSAGHFIFSADPGATACPSCYQATDVPHPPAEELRGCCKVWEVYLAIAPPMIVSGANPVDVIAWADFLVTGWNLPFDAAELAR